MYRIVERNKEKERFNLTVFMYIISGMKSCKTLEKKEKKTCCRCAPVISDCCVVQII